MRRRKRRSKRKMFICIGTSNPAGTIYCNGAKMADREKFYHLPMLSTTFFVVYTLIYSHYSTSFLLQQVYIFYNLSTSTLLECKYNSACFCFYLYSISRLAQHKGRSQITFTRGKGIQQSKNVDFLSTFIGQKCQWREVCGQRKPKPCQHDL